MQSYQDDDRGKGSGSVYAFTYDGTAWTEQQKITPLDGAPGENFGISIDLQDNRMVIGAYRDDDNGANAGSIYLFVHDAAGWTESAKITALDGDAGDYFGLPAAISADDIVVAACNDDDRGENAGAAYVYGAKTTSVPLQFPQGTTATCFQLLPAYPNPFNPGTTIRYVLPQPVEVDAAIYNMRGQRIRTLKTGSHVQGAYEIY